MISKRLYKSSNILSSEVEGQNPPIAALAARGQGRSHQCRYINLQIFCTLLVQPNMYAIAYRKYFILHKLFCHQIPILTESLFSCLYQVEVTAFNQRIQCNVCGERLTKKTKVYHNDRLVKHVYFSFPNWYPSFTAMGCQ